jgi:hypothetical protein
MALSFFQSLNPTSKNSGIKYPSYTVAEEQKGQEIIDTTISEKIKYWHTAKKDIGVREIFDILVGSHYSFGYLGQCSKGMLDYLIFPLFSRVLLNEFDHNNIFITALAWTIALGSVI